MERHQGGSHGLILYSSYLEALGNSAHRADPAAHPGRHAHRHPLRLQQRPPADGGGQGSGGGGALPPRGGGDPRHESLDKH